MILDKSIPNADINGDAPPTYEATVSRLGVASSAPTTKGGPPLPCVASPPIIIAAKPSPPSTSWFALNFPSPTARHVRATILGLIRDLVKLPPADHSLVVPRILKSCADACAVNGLSISTILQERSVEGHTPLYWAIIKRPPDSDDGHSLDLLTALLGLSTPLTPATISDVRLACLLTSDQTLFQRLRNSPEFAPLSATDEMLLDATIPPDEIVVENVASDTGAGAFAVDFAIMCFQKRMNVSTLVVLEFIARGRMWRLSFNVAMQDRMYRPCVRRGTWYVALALLEQSPPTWVDSRLLVPAPPQQEAKVLSEAGGSGLFGGKARPRPTLSVRIQAKEQLHARRGGHGNEIIVPLDGTEADGGMGGLQYAGCPYIATDETLRGRLEARLVKPEAECVIC